MLAADDGTESMTSIARAVQRGASASLNRQFRTLGLLWLLMNADAAAIPVTAQARAVVEKAVCERQFASADGDYEDDR